MNRQSFLAGLICGEGSFFYYISKGKKAPRFRFMVQMHKRDYMPLVLLSEELGVGKIRNLKYRPTMCRFEVTTFEENVKKVIPYFDGQLIGYKKARFEMWKEKLLKYYYANHKERKKFASALKY